MHSVRVSIAWKIPMVIIHVIGVEFDTVISTTLMNVLLRQTELHYMQVIKLWLRRHCILGQIKG